MLTAYNGTAITYDQIGNRLTDGTWTYTWEHGRELATMSNGATTWSYTYDANGLRTQRTNGTTTYTYFYSGSQLVQMQVGSDTLYFTYDPLTGAPVTVEHNGTVYYYITNQQGDVIGISGNWGNGEAHYYYDAWGRPVGTTSTTGIMQLNPLRYRGYVYDRETGLYYLQSRYYDPEIGRFINADAYAATGQGFVGNNMFVYCLNNPVNYSDQLGELAAAEGVIGGVLTLLPALDGPLPIGEVLTIVGIIGLYLYENIKAEKQAKRVVSNISSASINWNGDKNHILKGTKKKHVNGWKRFGIDPDNDNAWQILLPFLEEVVDEADSVKTTMLSNGAMYVQYFKTYVEEGVEIMVKIWVDATGTIQKISDAIPYILGD